MSDDGSIPREQLVRVLELNGKAFGYDGTNLTFAVEGNPEVLVLPENVPRRMIHRVSKKLEIDPAQFYHPEMAERGQARPH
jgi:hypothetical protein